MKAHQKNQILFQIATLTIAMALFGVGCAKKKDGGGETPAPAIVTPVVTDGRGTDGSPTGYNYSTGSTTDWNWTNWADFNTYVASHPLNSPQALKMNVDLQNTGANEYYGTVQISYNDNGTYYNGYFEAKNANVQNGCSHGHDGKHHAVYNKWFTDPVADAAQNRNHGQVFHGFFEDAYGAVMIIVNNSEGLGDGGVSDDLSGEIWYKNYQKGYAPKYQDACDTPGWFRELGPYDVRTFLVNGEDVNTTHALYPDESSFEAARGWRKLGNFNGLKRSQAFKD